MIRMETAQSMLSGPDESFQETAPKQSSIDILHEEYFTEKDRMKKLQNTIFYYEALLKGTTQPEERENTKNQIQQYKEQLNRSMDSLRAKQAILNEMAET
jgi:hypothetical protein